MDEMHGVCAFISAWHALCQDPYIFHFQRNAPKPLCTWVSAASACTLAILLCLGLTLLLHNQSETEVDTVSCRLPGHGAAP